MKVTIVYEKMNLAINKIDEVENQFNDIHDKQLENIATSLQDYSKEHSNCFDDSLYRIDKFKLFISSLQVKLNKLQDRCKTIKDSFDDSENNKFKNYNATRDSLKQALKAASIEVKDDDKIDAELQHQWLSPEDAIREGYKGEKLLTEEQYNETDKKYGDYESYLNEKREEWEKAKVDAAVDKIKVAVDKGKAGVDKAGEQFNKTVNKALNTIMEKNQEAIEQKRKIEQKKYLNKENLLTEEEYKRRNPDGNYEDYLNQKVDEAKKQELAKEFEPKDFQGKPTFQESIDENQKFLKGVGTLLTGAGEGIKNTAEELVEKGKTFIQDQTKDMYVVQEGDNLYKIATEKLGNGSRYKEIAELNDIDGTNINPRDIIKLPGADEHIVTAGDNIFKIAREKLGDESRWQEIAELNGLNAENGYEINPGQKLKMPTDNTYDTLQEQLRDINNVDSTNRDITTYSVQSGDSLYKIAREKLGDESRWQEIAELNGLSAENGYVINVDQKLKLPEKK